jgi:flagellar biogenesis protein FliO
METGLQLLKTIGALALIVGMLFAIVYVLRRWGVLAAKPATQATIEVLSKQSFGPRHHLFLVRVTGERKVLVGVSPQNMSLLAVTESALPGKNAVNDVTENI